MTVEDDDDDEAAEADRSNMRPATLRSLRADADASDGLPWLRPR